MGQKDIIEKNLEDFNDVFADIVNVLIFQGKRVIKPRELKSLTVRSQYKADDGKLHEEERDNAKYWSKGRVNIALLGLENQTKTDPDMPFRVIAYDGAAYRSQLLSKKSKQRCPVLSVVLYFGNSHWSGAKTIHEMIQIPDELKEYVNDYKIHIFEISHLTEQQVKLFKSDFRIVADYFVQVQKHKTYIPCKKIIKHVDAILKFMSIMTGDQRFSDISEKAIEGGDKNMCEVLDRIENQGIEKGIKIGEDNMRAERDSALIEKDNALAEAEILRAENNRMKKLLAKYNIATA